MKTTQTILLVMFFTFTISKFISTNVQAHEFGDTLQVFQTEPCERGFIRPAGVSECLNIADILDNKINVPIPYGNCPQQWKKYRNTELCLPDRVLVVCGKDSFRCKKEQGDTFRLVNKATPCGSEQTPILIMAAMFNTSGEYFANRPTIACAPIIDWGKL